MKINFTMLAAVALTLAICAGAQDKPAPMAHEHHAASTVAAPATWKTIQTLSGEWDGTMPEENERAHIVFHMSSGATAFIQTIDPGGKHEMLTIFTLDKGDVLGTHFCMGNQPRFRAVAGNDPNILTFELKDWTGIDSPGHMQGLVLTLVDADHHYEDWTYIIDGKALTQRFDMHRAKK
jgi:hypothetical protein